MLEIYCLTGCGEARVAYINLACLLCCECCTIGWGIWVIKRGKLPYFVEKYRFCYFDFAVSRKSSTFVGCKKWLVG